MPSIHETAYPRLRNSVSQQELAEIYTPSAAEIQAAKGLTRGDSARLGFLVLLKTFQRLGYFVTLKAIPSSIIEHIAKKAELSVSSEKLARYAGQTHLILLDKSLFICIRGEPGDRYLQLPRTPDFLAY